MSKYIISRADGRIYVGMIKLVVVRTGGMIGWGDTDMPKNAIKYETTVEAEWWSNLLRTYDFCDPFCSILLANPKLRDFAVRPLTGARVYDGQKLARPVDAERLDGDSPPDLKPL